MEIDTIEGFCPKCGAGDTWIEDDWLRCERCGEYFHLSEVKKTPITKRLIAEASIAALAACIATYWLVRALRRPKS